MRRAHRIVSLVCLIAVFSLLAAPAPAATTYAAPVQGPITGKFDLSNGQFAAGGHRGIDFGVNERTPVSAAAKGTVTFAGETPEGPYVTIQHESGVETTYALGEIRVSRGQTVAPGQMIGLSGRAHPGSASTVHFGARVNGSYVDPELLLNNFDDISDAIGLDVMPRGPGSSIAQASTQFSPGTADLEPVALAPAPPDVAEPAGQPPILQPQGPQGLGYQPINSEIWAGPGPKLRGPRLPSRFFTADFVGEGGVGDGPHIDPRTGLPLFNSPSMIREWWDSLSGEDRNRRTESYPSRVGRLVGLPVEARDRANRLALQRKISSLEKQIAQRDRYLQFFPTYRYLFDHRTPTSRVSKSFASMYEGLIGLTPWRRRMTSLSRELAGAKNLKERLDSVAEFRAYHLEKQEVFLLEVNTAAAWGDGEAVVALGDPTKAEYIGLVVPGINNALLDVEGPIGNAAALRASVWFNEGTETLKRTSTIMWLGYDSPNGLLDATNEAEAREGAPRLMKFVDGLRQAHVRQPVRRGYSTPQNRDPHIFGVSHSYGSTTAGMATKRGMDVDAFAALGSPGGGARYGRQLWSIHRTLWAARTPDDPIKMANWVPVLGQDPTDPEFGAQLIPLDVRQRGHGGYYELGYLGLQNLGWILTGRYEKVSNAPS